MRRPLPEAMRQARIIHPNDEIHPTYGTWTRVKERVEVRNGGGRLVSIDVTLAGGQLFHFSPSHKIWHRRQP